MKKSEPDSRDIKTQVKERNKLQSEISNTKNSMRENQRDSTESKITHSELNQKITEIKSILEKTEINNKHETERSKNVNSNYLAGSLCIAIGFGILCIAYSEQSRLINIAQNTLNPTLLLYANSQFFFMLTSCSLLLFAGMLMIIGAFLTSSKPEKYPIVGQINVPIVEYYKNLYHLNFSIFLSRLLVFCSLLVMIIAVVLPEALY